MTKVLLLLLLSEEYSLNFETRTFCETDPGRLHTMIAIGRYNYCHSDVSIIYFKEMKKEGALTDIECNLSATEIQ